MSTTPTSTVTPQPTKGRRKGVILLFVVVLLTLLAVIGSAFLISTRVNGANLGADARGGPVDAFGRDAKQQVEDVRAAATRAAQLTLFLDLFESQRLNAGNNSGERAWPGAGLHWRPTRAAADELLPRTTAANVNVYAPMADYGNDAYYPTTDPNPFVAIAADDPNALRFPYYNVDAVGLTDPHLASRTPRYNDNGTAGDLSDDLISWDWVSAPLVGVPGLPVDNIFIDPRNGSIAADLDATPLARANLTPTVIALPYATPEEELSFTGNAAFYNDRARAVPALFNDADGNGQLNGTEVAVLAGDADGDGVADGGLVPIVFEPGFAVGDARRYIDANTRYGYTYTIRIVDNNAAVNVNTALMRRGDVDLLALARPYNQGQGNTYFDADDSDTTTADEYNIGFAEPNRGIWPANIGLFELMPLRPGSTLPETVTNLGTNANDTMEEFVPTLLGAGQNSDITGDFLANRLRDVVAADVQVSSLGEAFSLGIANRFDNPEAIGASDTTPTPFYGRDDEQALLFRGGGWLNPSTDRSRLERTAEDMLGTMAGNFAADSELTFKHWPLYDTTEARRTVRRSLWAQMFNTADPDRTSFNFPRSALGLGTDITDLPVSPRAGVVARNGVSMAISPNMLTPAVRDLSAAALPAGMPPYANQGTATEVRPPVKAGLNTAGFGELFRAYWNIMVDNEAPPALAARQFAAPATGDEFAFDGVLPSTGTFTREQALLLRAAITSVNTMDIRDIEDATVGVAPIVTPQGRADLTVAEIPLGGYSITPTPTPTSDHTARVFGTEAQPFITEVIVQYDDPAAPTRGGEVVPTYVAVEIVNPYPYDLPADGWKLVANEADTFVAGGVPGANFEAELHAWPDGEVIPAATFAGGVLTPSRTVIEVGTRPDATHPLGEITDPTTQTTANLNVIAGTGTANVAEVRDRAIFLVRPVVSQTAVAELLDDENLVPLDMVNTAGVDPQDDGDADDNATTDVQRWRYARQDAIGREWKFVYHGNYTAANATGIDTAVSEGLVEVAAGGTNVAGTLGLPKDDTLATVTVAATEGFPLGPVLGGPVGMPGATLPTYPYGGFARAGDALAVPIVGSYIIRNATGNIVAARPVTVDLNLSDSDGGDDRGRLIARDALAGTVYAWASDALEYLTATHNFGEDTFPNADLRYFGGNGDESLAAGVISIAADRLPLAMYRADQNPEINYAPAAGRLFTLSSPLTALAVIDNDGDGVGGLPTPPIGNNAVAQNRFVEAFLPAQGLLNIFTGDAGILKLAPLDVDSTSTGQADPAGVTAVADLLVATTDVDLDNTTPIEGTARGPYVLNGGTPEALIGLNDLGAFFSLNGANTGAANGRRLAGDLSGLAPGATDAETDIQFYDLDYDTANTTGGYEDAITDLARVSNLLTTRSDSYTVYLVVQAWENFGGVDPETGNAAQARIVRQERIAFTVDRSGVYPLGNGFARLAGADGTGAADTGYTTIDLALDALKITPIPAQ